MNGLTNNIYREAYDVDRAIQYATEDYISSLDLSVKHEVEELGNGLMLEIKQRFDEHNIVSEKGNKWQYLKSLPNICVAKLILVNEPVRSILFTGKKVESCLGVYQEDGDSRGLYAVEDIYFNKLVRKYKFGATMKDVKEVVEILNAEAEFASLNDNRDLIAVNNGIFDYRTKELMPFSPQYVFTAKSSVDYVPNAVNPHFTMHDGLDWDVESWFASLSDDLAIINLLWEVVGAIIRPHVRWDKIICMYSQKGMNGKGTLCELMKQLCGNDSYASIPFDAFDKDFALSELITATAIITDENGTTEFTKNASLFKSIATGDSVSINRKYKAPITTKFSGLIVECINALPKIADTTDSLYRRFLIIPFEKTFVGCERKYIKSDYLHRKEVLEYVLWKVLNTNYYHFSEPDACANMLNDYKSFNDNVRQFFEEVAFELQWDLVPYKFLYALYKAWLNDNVPSASPVGKATFINKIKMILEDDLYADMWEYTMYPENVTKTNMAAFEPLVEQYKLKEWETNKSAKIGGTFIKGSNYTDKHRGLKRKHPIGGLIAKGGTDNE